MWAFTCDVTWCVCARFQVALLRLNQDCAKLTGLAALHQARASQRQRHGDGFYDDEEDEEEDEGGEGSESWAGASGAAGKARQAGLGGPELTQAMADAAVISPALTSLVRKLMASRQRGGGGGGGGGEAAGGDDVFVVGADDLARWLAEASQLMSAEGRARATAAADAATWERRQLQVRLFRTGALQRAARGLPRSACMPCALLFLLQVTSVELEEEVGKLAEGHDVFMRRHAIRVETLMVDRAMSLLQVSRRRRLHESTAQSLRGRARDEALATVGSAALAFAGAGQRAAARGEVAGGRQVRDRGGVPAGAAAARRQDLRAAERAHGERGASISCPESQAHTSRRSPDGLDAAEPTPLVPCSSSRWRRRTRPSSAPTCRRPRWRP